MSGIKLYDSAKKEKCEFQSIKPKKLRMYVCGPTAYDYAHLGHARSSIVFDLWRRVFLANGYEVVFAKNFTDIDDKIIKKLLDSKRTDTPFSSMQELSEFYIQSYLEEMDLLNVLRADIEPRAMENLVPIIEMIEKLLASGYAYEGANGDVYLSIQKDPLYGSLSSRAKEDSQSLQSRIENKSDKIESRDFALWKGYKGEEDLGFVSNFGKGRPGWHIECSAMIEKHLAYKDETFCIDIHAGGADLLFPHHENEASQTRCATQKELAKYWLHNGFVTINGEKMSKSLGNSFFLKDALRAYHGEIVRNYLLGVHYRLSLSFNELDLLSSKKRLDKIYRLKKRLNGEEASTPKEAKALQEFYQQNLQGADSEFVGSLLGALNEDLNISKALSVIEEMLNHTNELLDKNPKDKELKARAMCNLNIISTLLGVGALHAQEYFQLGVSEEKKAIIENLINKRAQAKAQKDYENADSLREELKNMGVEIMDTPQGTNWEYVG
ncbi:cysteine--tRNA ligase [Helicobacter himalayensis]|uniref:cysteine--tRNA ligase n=1 Tax=Helicobacter himalayensis TaxID=1591088 RepID=UPI003D6FA259